MDISAMLMTTLMLAESEHDLQLVLDSLIDYCSLWKLSVNESKAKVAIFARGRCKNIKHFIFRTSEVDVVPNYTYLGVNFNYIGRYNGAVNNLIRQANKSSIALHRRIRTLNLLPDISMELYDSLVVPILLYGVDVWGDITSDMLEREHLRCCKYTLSVKKSTTINMVYGEIDRAH
jgi:hypothetical protein